MDYIDFSSDVAVFQAVQNYGPWKVEALTDKDIPPYFRMRFRITHVPSGRFFEGFPLTAAVQKLLRALQSDDESSNEVLK